MHTIKILIDYKNKLINYFLYNQEGCIIDNILKMIVFHYDLNKDKQNLDRKSIGELEYKRRKDVEEEKERLYLNSLHSLNCLDKKN